MISYLADRYAPASSPFAVDTAAKRAVLSRWIAFANSTLCSDLSAKNSRSCDVLAAVLSSQGAACAPCPCGAV